MRIAWALVLAGTVACGGGASKDTGDTGDTDDTAVDSDVPEIEVPVEEILALTPDLENGESMYVDYAECSLCHGLDGDGTDIPDGSGSDFRDELPKLTDEEIVRTVFLGVDEEDSLMVGFAFTNEKMTKRFMSNQEIADVIGYIKTFVE